MTFLTCPVSIRIWHIDPAQLSQFTNKEAKYIWDVLGWNLQYFFITKERSRHKIASKAGGCTRWLNAHSCHQGHQGPREWCKDLEQWFWTKIWKYSTIHHSHSKPISSSRSSSEVHCNLFTQGWRLLGFWEPFIFRKISLNVKQTASENPLSSEERTWNLLHKSFLGKRAQIIILMWIPLIRQLWRGESSCSLDEQLQPIFLFCGSHDFGWIFCSNQV